MIDQLIIGNKYSYDDFEASVKERKISSPKKKSIKESVPFSNVTYDFSAMNGEIYWEERELEYVLEITALTPEEVEEKKIALASWLMNVVSEEIYDPFITDFHFVGTFDDIEYDDSEIEKTTITVKFTAYPYKIANFKKTHSFSVTEAEELTVKIANNSSHRITPTFNADTPFSLVIGSSSYGLPTGETISDSIKFETGENEIKLIPEFSGTISVSFYEEVF